MKKIFAIGLLFVFLTTNGQGLSDHSRFSVLTCGPGSELYSSFGHTALRVTDEVSNIDMVFNYGTFDPSQEHFYQKFIQGELIYFLSISDFAQFYDNYAKEGRVIIEQVLNLSTHQKNIIWDKLHYDYSEENKYYQYDFVKTNCTTKISDIINLIDPVYVFPIQESFRSLLNSTIKEYNDELQFLVNLLMGIQADRLLRPRESICLPNIFMISLDKAKTTTNGKPLVMEKRVILHGVITPKHYSYSTIFLFVMTLVVICNVILLFCNYVLWIKLTKWMISPLLFINGLLGLLICFLGIVNFQLTSPNINILWCSPLALVLLPLLFTKKNLFQKYLSYINLLSCLICVLLLSLGLQKIELQAAIMLVILIIMYSIYIYGTSMRFKSRNRMHSALQCKKNTLL